MIGLLTATALLIAQGAPSCITSDRRVEDVVAAKARELGGHEYCQFRIYETLSDVDADGIDDFLVVFSVEGPGGGGNNTIQFLAAFASSNEWRPSVVEVGRRGQRMVEAITQVRQSGIDLSTWEYGHADAMCCPSRKGKLRLMFQHGRISLVAR
jgi:hypothetical protein